MDDIETEDLALGGIIAVAVAGGIILLLIGLVTYLLVKVYKLNKRLRNIESGRDNDSFDDDESVRQQPYEAPYTEPQQHQNPYNPLETFTIKRAKLMQSLRNKISNSPRQSEKDISNDYMQPISDLNSHLSEDDYPHPKNGTLKNEILTARSRMSKKKPPAPREWTAPNDNHHPRDRRSVTEQPRIPSGRGSELGAPPKDYPGFPGSRAPNNAQQFNRRPYVPSNNYAPPRPNRGLSKQESDTMAEYDQTIANEERGIHKPYQQNHGFLYSNKFPNN